MEHPAVAEAGVIGKPDPVAGEIVKAFVALKHGSRAERRRCAATARLRPHAARARPWRRRRSTSCHRCPGPAAARSCAACSRPANWACPKGTPRRWRRCHDAPEHARLPARRPCSDREHALRLLGEMLLHPSLRGEVAPSCTAPGRSAASCICTSARKRSRSARCRRSRRTTTSSPPTASTATPWPAACRRAGDGGNVRQGQRLQPRPRRLDALFDCERRFYGGNAIVGGGLAARGRAGARRQAAEAAARHRCASSATGRWPKASSTSR